MRHMHRAVGQDDHADDHREPGAKSRPHPAEGDNRREGDHDCSQQRPRVLTSGDTRLPVQQGVVNCVEDTHERQRPQTSSALCTGLSSLGPVAVS